MANEVEVEGAGDDAEEIWVLSTELFPYEDMGVSWNEMEGKEPVSDPFHYSEWDYQIQLERPAWATVLEKRAKSGDLQVIDDITAKYKREIHRMKFLLDAMQPQGVQRIRKLEDGDEIDINAAIASFIDIRLGNQPDPRIMMRSVRKTRDFSILVLLDLSESTNETVQGQEYSVRELTQQACVLLADAIDKVGDPFAIHGFCSDGRHDVEYYRFKDFDQHWDETPKAKLAGMTGQLSTRMGAAVRHAGHYLKLQRSAKKLLIVITDGEPADIDVRDPQYLRMDTKKAVEEVARDGVMTYCMSLDPRADNYVVAHLRAEQFHGRRPRAAPAGEAPAAVCWADPLTHIRAGRHVATRGHNKVSSMNATNTYIGFHNDHHGITQLGRIVLDGWVFGFIPETEDCTGWDLGRMQLLMDKISKEWDKYNALPSRLPPELQQRHTEIYAKAMSDARTKGWNPELGDDE